MRIVICAAVMAVFAVPAVAKDAPSAAASATDAVQSTKAARSLYVCDSSAMTRRGFAREYGSVQYVTAEEAKAGGEAWAAPKCITRSEARRLAKALASR